MKRRAISPAITTMVLIGVALLGGVSAGSAMFKQNEIVSKTTRVDIIKASLVHMESINKTFFSLTLKNTGTTTISSGSVGFFDDGGILYSLDIPKLEPGQTFGMSRVLDAGLTQNAKYPVDVRVQATDGSTYGTLDVQVAMGG